MSTNLPNRDRLDDALERLFDREMSADEQDRLARDLEHDPEALACFRDTTDILLALREPVSAPDVTDAVLGRMMPVRRRVARGRRLLSPSRVAVAAALVLAGVGLAVLQKPGRPRTTPTVLRSIELDPLLARMLDPQLAELELADLRMDPGAAAPRVAMIHQRATLNAPPLVFELSPVQSLAGAGEAAATFVPYQLVFENDLKNWLGSNGSIVFEPDIPSDIAIPRVWGPRTPPSEPSPILIQIENLYGWPLKSPPTPDRMLLWPEALELRLDLSEARQVQPSTAPNRQ